MERESPTPWLPFSRLLNFFGPLPDISLATWDLAPLSQHHCIRDMKMKIYPYLSDRREIYETVVKCVETCNLQKVWDSSVYISNDQRRFFNTMGCDHRGKGSEDFLTRWDAITAGKGRGKWGEKRTILSYFIVLDRSLFQRNFRYFSLGGTSFTLKLSS